MNYLHILNGDGTAHPFRQTDLPGETLVWWEMLSEGWVPATDDLAGFWRQRGDFLAEHYGLDRKEQQDWVEDTANKLIDFRQFDEITLWFEFDLFCQINLLYLLNWFAGQDLGGLRLTLVSPGSHLNLPNFKGLGELSPVQLAALWPGRLTLTKQDLKIGQRAWRAYVSPLSETLPGLLLNEDFGQLVHLRKALQAHLRRFPVPENGLGAIEQFWLNEIRTGATDSVAVMQRFWNENPGYGLGDSQLLRTLNELEQAGLVRQNGSLRLTDRGGVGGAGKLPELCTASPLVGWR